jgi:hypothetical protein
LEPDNSSLHPDPVFQWENHFLKQDNLVSVSEKLEKVTLRRSGQPLPGDI